jgi:hypothetical protein
MDYKVSSPLREERMRVLRKLLLTNTDKPLLPGNCELVTLPLNEGHEQHISKFVYLLGSLQYSQIKRTIRRWSEIYSCRKCLQSILITVAHCKVLGHSRGCIEEVLFCLKRYSLPEGQEILESLPKTITLMMNIGTGPGIKEFIEMHPFLRTFSQLGSEFKLKNRRSKFLLPHLNAFPRWEIKKESKMWLTELDPPTEDNLIKLERILRKFLYPLKNRVFLLDAEAAAKDGRNLYYDGFVKKHDYERVTYSYHNAFKYEKYLTGPLTEREVWIPSKAYKTNSSWWTYVHSQLLSNLSILLPTRIQRFSLRRSASDGDLVLQWISKVKAFNILGNIS